MANSKKATVPAKKSALKIPEKTQSKVALPDLQKYFLVAAVIGLLGFFFYFISPFFAALIVAGVIAIDIMPMNDWLTKKVRYKLLASFLSMLTVLLVIITPFTLLSVFVINEATSAYNRITANGFNLNLETNLLTQANERFGGTIFYQIIEPALSSLTLATTSLNNLAGEILEPLGRSLLAQTGNIFFSVSMGFLIFIVFTVALYYFLCDGKFLVAKTKKLLPLPIKYKNELFAKLNDLSKGIIYGVFGSSLIQGVVAGLGFYLVGVPNAALWGTIMAIFAPVPYIGTAIIWGPVGIYNLINGEVFSGLFVLIWGVAVVATIDNIVKPYLIGRSTAINPLAILLTLLGGILLFGPSGLIYGPFLLTLLFGVLHIYELEYEEVLKD